ncbi:MAG: hypothetical protein U0176_08375 [Bacteroidia bacterium]
MERAADVIIHHVMDSHDWHITDIGETAISLPLPWIVYNSQKGLDFFMNTEAMLEGDNHYLESHGNLYYVKSNVPVATFHDLTDPAEKEEFEKRKKRVLANTSSSTTSSSATTKPLARTCRRGVMVEVFEKMEGVTVIDFSMTKTALQILIVAIVMLLLFTRVAKAYKQREGMAPKGLQ